MSSAIQVRSGYRALILVGSLLAIPLSAQAAGTGAAIPGSLGDPVPAAAGQAQAAYPSSASSPMPGRAAAPTQSSAGGIDLSGLPSPPPATAFSNDASQLAAQAEQAALQAQAQADLDQKRREQEHIEKSFEKSEVGMLPMAPEQIRAFMHRLEVTQDASVAPSTGPAKPESRVSTISLEPGVEAPQVNLNVGYVSTITIVDASGEPWPILDVGVGGSFEVSPTQNGTHVIRIMPLTRVGTGDLSVLLQGLTTPVIFRLSTGGPTVDLRYDARIGKMGPKAKPPLINRAKLEAGDQALTMILENAPPDNAKRVKVSGLDDRTKAWAIDDKLYVRTPLSMLSPAWNASVSSGDGMSVYEIGDAPVLLMSDNGAMVRALITRDDNHD